MPYITDKDFTIFKAIYNEKITRISKQLEILRQQIANVSGPTKADLNAMSIPLNEKINNLAKQISILNSKVDSI